MQAGAYVRITSRRSSSPAALQGILAVFINDCIVRVGEKISCKQDEHIADNHKYENFAQT